jgi:hypothetical protein
MARAGARRGKQAGGRRGFSRGNRRGHRQLGGRTDDIAGLRAATLPSSPRKIALAMKKAAENPIYGCQRFAAARLVGAYITTIE